MNAINRCRTRKGLVALCGGTIALGAVVAITGCASSNDPSTRQPTRLSGEVSSSPLSGSRDLTASSVTTVKPSADEVATHTPVIPDAGETRSAWREGVSLFESGDYDGAVPKLEIAASGRPDDSYTHYLLGLSLWKSRQTESAEKTLQRASSLNPESVKAWVNLGRVRLDLGQSEAALAAADSALGIDARCADAHHVRGRALSAMNRGQESLEALTQAHELSPENGYIANTLGHMLLVRGRNEEAIPLLEEACEKLPLVPYVRNNLGVAYERSGRIEEASEQYRAAVDAGDSSGKASASLARIEPMLTGRLARKDGSTAPSTTSSSSPAVDLAPTPEISQQISDDDGTSDQPQQ